MTALTGCAHTVAFVLDDDSVTGYGEPACSGFEDYAEDPSSPRAWAVGSELHIRLDAYGGFGECSLSGKIPLPSCTNSEPPQNPVVVATDPSVWQVVSGPDENRVVVVRAVGAGIGGITVSADNAEAATLELRAAAPAALRAVYDDPARPLDHLTVGTNATAFLALGVADADGQSLCVPRMPNSVAGNGVTVYGETSDDLIADQPAVARWIRVQTGESAGAATLDATLGERTLSVPVNIVASESLTRVSLSIDDSYETSAHVRVRTWTGEEEVIGGAVLLENLTPDAANVVDPVSFEESDSVTTREPIVDVRRNCTWNGEEFDCTAGTARIRASIEGASAEPVELDVVFTP